jgi:hypothetical protein
MNKIPSTVLSFAGANINVYKKFVDYYNHFRSNQGVKGVEFQTAKEDGSILTFGEKEDKMNADLLGEIMRVAGVKDLNDMPLSTWAQNPQISWAAFAVVSQLIDMVLPDSIIDTIGAYSEVKVGGWGDSFAFEIKPRDLFVVSKQGRDRRTTEIKKQYNGLVTVLPELRQLTVGVSLYRVLAGKESLAEFVSKAVRSLESQMTVDVYNAFATAMGNLATTTDAALKITGYTQSTMVELAQKVQAWNGGASPVIMGTRLALANILPNDANYRYDIESNFVKMGYMKTISGFDALMLPQVADWTTPFKTILDDTKLWLISPSAGKIVKLCLEGSAISNVTAPFQFADLSQNATIAKSWGTGIATSAIAGTIALA